MPDKAEVECAVTLTRDGMTAWYAEVHILPLGLRLHMLPVSGQTENEAMWDTYRWVREHLPELDKMVRAFGQGQLSFTIPTSPLFTPRGSGEGDDA